jgi:hypothetical protein
MPSKGQRWTRERAWEWYRARPWLVGFNYVPSYACNTTEWWQEETYDAAIIDRELGWGAGIGYNSARVFIQYIVWKADPPAFKVRFDNFLRLAGKHRMSVIPVLFDDCAFGEPLRMDPFPGAQPEPTPGMVMPSWTPSPGRQLGMAESERPRLRECVMDMVRTFGDDPRIVLWDLYNEPMNKAAAGTPALLDALFSWAEEAGPHQPISIGLWNDNVAVNEIVLARSDVVTFHCYGDLDGLRRRIGAMRQHEYPVISTEWMARATGSRFETDLPLFKSEGVGCYQWGLVNGRTQCQFPWTNKPGGGVNPRTGWFHDILYSDGRAYRPEEVEAIRRVIGSGEESPKHGNPEA